MLDSQIQAQGFVDLAVEATKDFFLFFFFIFYLNTFALESVVRHEIQPACHQLLLTRQSHAKCIVFLAIPDTCCP